MKRSAVIASALLSLAGGAFAFSPGRAGFFFEPRVGFGSDIQAGLRGGIDHLRLPAGTAALFLDFEGRPLPHPVKERVSPTFSYQYRERRIGIGPGISFTRPFGEAGEWAFVTAAGVAYSHGDYRGTSRRAVSGWGGWGEAGLRYSTDGSYSWGAALQYRPLPSINPFRLLVSMGWSW